MAQYTNEKGYRGLLIPDERLTPDTWDGAASFGEAGPRPGQAIPESNTTEAVLSVSGTQDSTTYNVICLRGGYVADAEFAWASVVSGTVGDYRGCNFPNLAMDVHNIGGGTTSATTAGWPESIRTNTGRVVWVWCKTTLIGTVRSIQVSYSDNLISITGADNSITLLSEDSGEDTYYVYTLDGPDCVCARWDDEREVIQVWVRVVDPANSLTQYVLFESDDDAVTWTLVQRNCLVNPYNPSDTLRRPVVGLVAGTLMLLQPEDDSSSAYTLTQFLSRDRGRTFELISSDASDHRRFSMVEFNNSLQIAAVNWSTNDVEVLRIATAYDPVITQTWDVVTGLTNQGHVALAVQHGRLYLFTTPASHHSLEVRCSTTGDANDWDYIGHDMLTFEGAATNLDIEKLSAVGAFGGVALAFQVNDTGVSTPFRNHLFALRCGGWNTVTTPRISPAGGDREGRVAFGTVNSTVVGTYYAEDRTTWYPFVAPDAITGAIWTVGGTGTDAAGMSVGGSPYRSVSCGAGTSRSWTQTFTGSPPKGVLVYFDCEVSTGGSVTSNDSAVRIVLTDGSTVEYNLTVRLSAGSGVYLKDNVGGSSLMVSADIVNRHAFFVAVREIEAGVSAIATIYSVSYSTLDVYYNWQELDSLTLSPDGTPAATSSVEFGVIGAGSAVAIAQKWYAFHYIAACGMTGLGDMALGTYAGVISRMGGGAPCSGVPSEIREGLRVFWSGGPLKAGETWSIAPRYDYAKEHVYPHLYPSPRQAWRSDADGASETFQWLFDATDEACVGLGAGTWGIALIGINFSAWELQGQEAGGTWQDIIIGDTAAEFTDLPYRAGVRSTFTAPYVTVDMGGTGGAVRYIHENEMAGGSIVIGSQYFKILRNTSGFWTPTAGKKPVLFLDPTTWDSSVPDTGVLSIRPPNALGVAHGLGSTEYKRLRFRITAQTTADGYYTIGSLIIGPVYVFGKQYSKGRTMSRTSNVGIARTAGGASSAVSFGPTSRTVGFGWFEGLDQSNIYDLRAEPDYVTPGNTAGEEYALAARYDTPTMLDGLYVRLNGPERPVVYIPNIPYDPNEGVYQSTDGASINGFVYGRTVGDIKMTTVTGTEQSDEVVQIGAIEISEEK